MAAPAATLPAMRVAILTISDSSSSGARPNLGGPTMRGALPESGMANRKRQKAVLPDERAQISEKLKQLADFHGHAGFRF